MVAVRNKIDAILEELQLEEFGIKRPPTRRKPSQSSDTLIQLNLTLLELMPAVWRRIQIKDCPLADLHKHIQTAMGWQNCHMHQFVVDANRYSTAMTGDFDFDDEFKDESSVMLSNLLPKHRKRFRFEYTYDFGDDWRHEVLFEGYPPIEKGKKYPLCLEGERACPPEDCGGPWGYGSLLEAMNDPDHEEHEEMTEWLGDFDPEEFSAEKATRAMRKSLPRY